MRALVLREHGGTELLRLETDFPDPVAGPGEVVLRVRATSLNYHDIFTRRGMPGIRIPFPVIMGLDVAGEIVSLGEGVEGWKIGDRVVVDPIDRERGGLMGETIHGGLAELCRAGAWQLIRIPDNVSFEQAAALPCAYGTALRMISRIGQVQAGEKVLILGASGGVGVCCVQLAKLVGAEVIACAGTEAKGEKLRALGADHIVHYTQVDMVKDVQARFGRPTRKKGSTAGGVDVAVNFTGGESWVQSLRCLRIGGRQLTCGATAGFNPPEDIRYIWTFELQIRGSNGWEKEDVVDLLGMVSAGKLTALVDDVLPLERGAEAMRRLEDRQVTGKIIVAP